MYDAFPDSIKVIRDVKYGPKERNALDVYIPGDNSPEKPVLVFAHGGGFFSGDKAWSDKVRRTSIAYKIWLMSV